MRRVLLLGVGIAVVGVGLACTQARNADGPSIDSRSAEDSQHCKYQLEVVGLEAATPEEALYAQLSVTGRNDHDDWKKLRGLTYAAPLDDEDFISITVARTSTGTYAVKSACTKHSDNQAEPRSSSSSVP